jgi:arylsulfatase A-like enzyme
VLWSLWAEGVRFDNAWATPLCSPTRAAALTGRWPHRNAIGHIVPHGYCMDGPVRQPSALEVFLPELLELGHALQASGVDYASAAFGKWHLSEFDCDPVRRGFDLFQGYQQNNGGPFPCELGIPGQRSHFRWRRIDCSASPPPACTQSVKGCEAECCWTVVGDGLDPAAWSAAVAIDDALAWIGALPASTPYLAWIAFNPPHLPQQVPPPTSYGRQTQTWLDFYGYDTVDGPQGQGGPNALFHRHLVQNAMIEAVDRQIGRLLDPATGIPQERLDRAIVFVVGDNGTDFNVVDPQTIDGAPLAPGHGKRSVFELGVRVPLVVRLPPSWPAPQAFAAAEGFVHVVDLWRTIAELTGLTDATIDAVFQSRLGPWDQPSDSLSFVPLLSDPSDLGPRETSYTEGFLRNGAPHVAPHSQAIVRRFDTATPGVRHRYKYLRVYDGTAGPDWECLIAPGGEGFYDLDLNPLEDPSGNLVGTSDPDLVIVLETLREALDGIYAMGACPLQDKPLPTD